MSTVLLPAGKICYLAFQPRSSSMLYYSPSKTVLHFGNKGPQDHLKCNRICDFKIESKKTLYQRDQGRSPGEGNGNPLQCSCLENPRDGGAWWAAVCGVTQSWTRLKQLSSMYINHHHNSRSIVGLLILQLNLTLAYAESSGKVVSNLVYVHLKKPILKCTRKC